VLIGLLVGTATNTFLGYETSPTYGLIVSLKGIGIAFLVYLPLYLLRGMGAGDVKLMAAVGAIVGGFGPWLWILFFTAILGGIAAVIVVLSKGRVHRTLQNLWMIMLSIRHGQAPYNANPELDVSTDQGLRLPHGVIIAIGAVGFVVAKTIWP